MTVKTPVSDTQVNNREIRYFGYLRVSRDTQEIDSQKLGLLQYANQNGFTNVELVEETISRDAKLKDRELGRLLGRVGRGDVIMTPEFTRLGSSPGQVFTFMEEVSSIGAVLHITKSRLVMDGSMQSNLLASAFSMASMIELDFIRMRTREGLDRARREGVVLGRPKGSRGPSKLDGREDEIRGYLAIRLPKRRMAKALKVSYNTLGRYLDRNIHLMTSL